jgi:hypothetical protein
LQGTLSASVSSSTPNMSGILTASKDAVRVLSRNGGCMSRCNTAHGSLFVPLSGPHGSLHGSPDSQRRILQSKGLTEFAASFKDLRRAQSHGHLPPVARANQNGAALSRPMGAGSG